MENIIVAIFLIAAGMTIIFTSEKIKDYISWFFRLVRKELGIGPQTPMVRPLFVKVFGLAWIFVGSFMLYTSSGI